jgi:hypothetical protein
VDAFLDPPLPRALKERRTPRPADPRAGRRGDGRRGAIEGARADEPLPEAVRRLAREPHAILEAASFDFDEVLDRIAAAASRFKVDRVAQADVARAGGAPADEEE